MLWKIEGGRRRGQQGMRWSVGWHHQLNRYEFDKLWEMVKDKEAWCAAIHGFAKSRIWVSDWMTIIALQRYICFCCITKWIGYMYTYIPSLSNLPPTPHPTPLGHHRAVLLLVQPYFERNCFQTPQASKSSTSDDGSVYRPMSPFKPHVPPYFTFHLSLLLPQGPGRCG